MDSVKEVIKESNIATIAFIQELIVDELESTNDIESIQTERKSVRNYIKYGENENLKEKKLVNHYLEILLKKKEKITEIIEI